MRTYNEVKDGKKRCRDCGRTLPVEQFHENGGGQYKPMCKECRSALRRGDPDILAKAREYKRRMYPLRRAEIDRRNMEWRRANPERVRELQRAAQKRARKARPDHWRAKGREQARRRQVGRNELAFEYGEILRRDPCSYCGASAATVDHIDALAMGGANEWSNLTAACGPCNSSKRDTPLLQWLAVKADG